MENRLRGAVLAKHPNISEFARAMNWDRKKASRIVNRKQLPTAKDMEDMAKNLDIRNADDFVQIFLPTVPTLWENK
jgi:transcriptional regulator with XRE-family HTH domain